MPIRQYSRADEDNVVRPTSRLMLPRRVPDILRDILDQRAVNEEFQRLSLIEPTLSAPPPPTPFPSPPQSNRTVITPRDFSLGEGPWQVVRDEQGSRLHDLELRPTGGGQQVPSSQQSEEENDEESDEEDDDEESDEQDDEEPTTGHPDMYLDLAEAVDDEDTVPRPAATGTIHEIIGRMRKVNMETPDTSQSTHYNFRLRQLREGTCPISYDPLIKPASLNTCGHVLCAECFADWASRASTCPCCRMEFAEKDMVLLLYHRAEDAGALVEDEDCIQRKAGDVEKLALEGGSD